MGPHASCPLNRSVWLHRWCPIQAPKAHYD
uniref:Uncharacterized protein n=1 Tax=Arundo donax TaxID=35708 RepID=A0A0A9A9A8_ARUDO